MTKYSSKNFSGVEEIYMENYISISAITIDITSINVKEGNLAMYVVNDDEIIHEFTFNENEEQITLEDLEGNFSIRLAGESASFTFYMNIN